MNVVFRTDASLQIGTGHVMRCLTLADALKASGVSCRFIGAKHPGNLLELIRQRGFEVHDLSAKSESKPQDDSAEAPLPRHASWLGADWATDAEQTRAALGEIPPDWLIVDHYALDQRWERALRPACSKLMVIDDLADRLHDCDVLLDQNLGRMQTDYLHLLPAGSKILVGPCYALLRPEFAKLRQFSLERRATPQLNRLLITMGGVDKDNATGRVLKVMKQCPLPPDCRITVVMGALAPALEQVRALAEDMPWATEVLVNVGSMARLMAECDLAIGAGGGTSWERCCLGLPSLVVVLAENQRAGTEALVAAGAAVSLGDANTIGQSLRPSLRLLMQGKQLQALSQASSAVTDGGGANRITEFLLAPSEKRLHAREARQIDELLLFEWANDPATRNNSFSPGPIAISTHRAWFAQRLADPTRCRIYIVESSGTLPVGHVRFERDAHGYWEIDYALAQHYRGLGLGKRLLETALNAFGTIHSDEAVIAKVKLANKPSRRVFDALNFSGTPDETAGIVIYRKTLGATP